ncbi:hypothetical protein AB4Z50_20255 [Paenibacillus sp. 2TAB26]
MIIPILSTAHAIAHDKAILEELHRLVNELGKVSYHKMKYVLLWLSYFQAI